MTDRDPRYNPEPGDIIAHDGAEFQVCPNDDDAPSGCVTFRYDARKGAGYRQVIPLSVWRFVMKDTDAAVPNAGWERRPYPYGDKDIRQVSRFALQLHDRIVASQCSCGGAS